MTCNYCGNEDCKRILIPCPKCKKDNEWCSYGDSLKEAISNVNEINAKCWNCGKLFDVINGYVQNKC